MKNPSKYKRRRFIAVSGFGVRGGACGLKIGNFNYAASRITGQRTGKMTLKRADVLIALGSNQPSQVGNAVETVAYAIKALATAGPVLRAQSAFYLTSAFPAGSGPDFVNAAVRLDWDAPAHEILGMLHRIEASLDRTRASRWAPRTVDLDLIAIGGAVLPDAQTQRTWRTMPLDQQMKAAPDTLILPHPRLQDRAFVLVPLADVAPDWVHPLINLSVREMLDALPPGALADVRPLRGPDFPVVNMGDRA